MTAKSVRVRTLPGGLIRLDLDDGVTPVSVELAWRLVLRLTLRLTAATAACASQEMDQADFEALFQAEDDQVTAEIAAHRGGR